MSRSAAYATDSCWDRFRPCTNPGSSTGGACRAGVRHDSGTDRHSGHQRSARVQRLTNGRNRQVEPHWVAGQRHKAVFLVEGPRLLVESVDFDGGAARDDGALRETGRVGAPSGTGRRARTRRNEVRTNPEARGTACTAASGDRHAGAGQAGPAAERGTAEAGE